MVSQQEERTNSNDVNHFASISPFLPPSELFRPPLLRGQLGPLYSWHS